ncbi:MAG: transcriptional repressor [Firmicutes bacterium]|nr:transcriptional repressor [Bacillota bacterium]
MSGRLRRAERKLAEKGLRITPQRRTVLETLRSHQGRPLTAEEIHWSARTKGSKLSIATVYRALSGLEKLGLVTRLDPGSGPATYELALMHPEPHCHLVCLGGGQRHGSAQASVEVLVETLVCEEGGEPAQEVTQDGGSKARRKHQRKTRR